MPDIVQDNDTQHNASWDVDILGLLRHNLRLIVLTIIFFVGLGFAYLSTVTPIYSARALVLVQPGQKDLLESGGGGSSNPYVANAFIESELEILASDQVILAAIEKGNLLADPLFGPRLGRIARLKQALGMQPSALPSGDALLHGARQKIRGAMSVRRRGLSYIVSVGFSSPDPKRAAEIANLLAQTYIDLQIESKVASTLAARDVLQSQLGLAQERLAASESNLADYIDANIVALEQQTGDPELRRLRLLLEAGQTDRLQAQTRLQAAQDAYAVRDWTQLSTDLSSDALDALDRERRSLALRLDLTDATSSVAIDLKAEIARLEEQMTSEAQIAIDGLEGQIAGLTDRGDTLRDDLRTALLASKLPATALAELYAIQQNGSVAQSQYDTLLLRVRDLEARASVQIADSRLVSQALAPRAASSPRTKLVLALCAMLGVAVGVGWALLNEFVIGGVHSVSQLTNLSRMKTVQSVPRAATVSGMISAADLVIKQPLSVFAEGMRRVRANVDRLSRSHLGTAGDARVVVVTSSMPAEGKSVVSLSLARTYAASGKRVLLIDADMRKPSQFKLLGVEPKSGLLEFLTGREAADSDEFYDLDPLSELGVILGRRRSDVPTDQPLQSTAFEDLLASARENFDVVVIDTPPLGQVVDARYIVPHADCVVMVVRAGATRQGEIRFGLEQLREALMPDTPVVTLLNLAQRDVSGGRYGKGYYGEED